MKVHLDISENLKDQFTAIVSAFSFDPKSGYDIEKIAFLELAEGLEFYHFQPIIHESAVEMTSINPENSEWYLIHVNIGRDQQEKLAGEEKIDFHKFQASGVLLYCPGLNITTTFQAGHHTELFSLRFSKSFLGKYLSDDEFLRAHYLLYEDLDFELESLIYRAIGLTNRKFLLHARILEILEHVLQKVRKREAPDLKVNLHQSDIEYLFKASAFLRDPTSGKVPAIGELASISQMSISKFKRAFKQLFGLPPHKYHLKVKMEYAREILRRAKKSPKQLSYDLGYSHPSNFTSAYKNFYGKLPSEDYRNALK